MKTVADQIKDARKAAGMTQEQLAEALDVNRSSISHWESGRHTPDVESMKKLSNILSVSFMIADEQQAEEADTIPSKKSAAGEDSLLPAEESASPGDTSLRGEESGLEEALLQEDSSLIGNVPLPEEKSILEEDTLTESSSLLSGESAHAGTAPISNQASSPVEKNHAVQSPAPVTSAPVSKHVTPQPKKKKRLLLWCAVAAAVVLFAVIFFFTRPAADQYASADGSAVYRIEDFTTAAERIEGQGYLAIDKTSVIHSSDDHPLWMYTFTIREDAGIPFHISRIDLFYLQNGRATTQSFSEETLRNAEVKTQLAPWETTEFTGGMPLKQNQLDGVGLKIYGADETGNSLVFSSYIPHPQE